jgi:hypothetical protein
MGKKLVVIMGKGGVGKSLLGRATLCHANQENLPVVAFDGDASNSSLARFYPQAHVVDVDGDMQTSNWYETNVIPPLLETDNRIVLLDLGAGSERLFRRWCLENNAPEVLREHGAEMVIWHVMDPTLDSISPFLDAVLSLPKVRQVVWFNHGLAKGLDLIDPEKAFAAIRREPEYIQAIKGRLQLAIPNLQASPQIDAQDLSFEVAAAARESPLHLFERIRVYHWLQAVSAAISKAL